MKFAFAGLLATAVLAAGTSVASADVVFELNEYKQDAAIPDGTSPWIVATFANDGANTVKLTLDASNLGSGNFIPFVYINSNTAVTGAALFSGPTNFEGISAGGTPPGSGVDFSYTLAFQGPNSPAGGRFSGGEIAVLTLTGTGLTEDDFNVTINIPKDAYLNSDVHIAARIQGISTEPGSTVIWDTPDDDTPRIPEPASLGLLGLGALALLTRRRAK